MRVIPMVNPQRDWTLQADRRKDGSLLKRAQYGDNLTVHEIPSLVARKTRGRDTRPHWRSGEFFTDLSIQTIREFESITAVRRYPAAAVLIREEQQKSDVLFLIEGRVKLSINSVDGRRLMVGIALAGDILGLTSAISGFPHVITAETQFPCVIATLKREAFLGFLVRCPMACQNVMHELSLDYNRAAQQLRIIGLTQTARAKLARLYLGWGKEGEQTTRGVRIQCALTHAEIGEQIGVSRETISRTMKDFRNQGLVEQRGSILVVKNLEALEAYQYAI